MAQCLRAEDPGFILRVCVVAHNHHVKEWIKASWTKEAMDKGRGLKERCVLGTLPFVL